MMIKKDDLNIDGRYQREQISEQKVIKIASKWNWKYFGAICVIRRKDGSYWVFDGGHRSRAAFYRDDVIWIPCIVFDSDDLKEEADAFVGTNTLKSSVAKLALHRAAVLVGDPIALAAEEIVVANGWEVSKNASKRYCFKAIHTLHNLVKRDRDLAANSFSCCARISIDGEPIPGDVVEAIFECQYQLKESFDMFHPDNFEKLDKATIPGIAKAIEHARAATNIRGRKIDAMGILMILNKGRKRRLSFQ